MMVTYKYKMKKELSDRELIIEFMKVQQVFNDQVIENFKQLDKVLRK